MKWSSTDSDVTRDWNVTFVTFVHFCTILFYDEFTDDLFAKETNQNQPTRDEYSNITIFTHSKAHAYTYLCIYTYLSNIALENFTILNLE